MDADEEVVKENVNITQLLSQLVLDQYEWIKESGIKMEVDIEERDIIKESNGTMLTRILNNFFSNARKYCNSFLNVSMSVSKDDHVIIVFANDIEPGMNIDTARIFEAFYRDDVRHKEGAGLGLYVVKCLCDKLGYLVTAEVIDDIFKIQIDLCCDINRF